MRWFALALFALAFALSIRPALRVPVVEPSKPADRCSAALEFWAGPSVVGRPVRSSPAVLADVLARLPNQEYWRDQTDPTDLVTWTHEGTHGVSVRVPKVRGAHGIYLLGGRSVSIAHPRLTIGDVAAAIPESQRGRIYQLYLVEQRRDWDAEPIYLVEEWVAYVHGTFARRELGLSARGETEDFAREMEFYCRVMLALAAKVDPNYPDAEKLAAFIEWNSERFRRAVE